MINCDRTIVDIPTIKKEYRTTEILEKLGKIFHNKCYLCETKEDVPSIFQIDHFISQSKDSSKKLDWNNLYLACGDTCNQYKSNSFDNILDPCNPEHNVEELIIYELEFIDFIPHFYSNDESNPLVKNTCNLLEKIHNNDENDFLDKRISLKNAIRRRATQLLKVTKEYIDAKYRLKDNIKKQKSEQKIKEIVSKKSPYTMLMRSEAKKDGLEYLFD